jgi:hypothetical protein
MQKQNQDSDENKTFRVPGKASKGKVVPVLN